jgi:hypothetical protein
LQSFNEYFSAEHSRLLSLWRTVVAFRRQFSEMKTATERDMSYLRADITRAARSMHSACLNLSANMRSADTQQQVSFVQIMQWKGNEIFFENLNLLNTIQTLLLLVNLNESFCVSKDNYFLSNLIYSFIQSKIYARMHTLSP